MPSMNLSLDRLKISLGNILDELGLDRENENFVETPQRVGKFFLEFTSRLEPKLKTFNSDCLDVVSLDGYTTWGLCPHHLLPVRYQATIQYTPDGKVFGISKLPRIFDYLLRTLPLQEDLPKLVVDYLREKLNPSHVHCTVKGMHLCMTMRGVKAKDCILTTSATWRKHAQSQVSCK